MTAEQAKVIAEKKLPKNAKITSVTDYKGHYIFTFDDPQEKFHNLLAVNKLTKKVGQFDLFAERPLGGFVKAFKEQNPGLIKMEV